MDSWFREIHVPRVWRVHLATGFDFHETSKPANQCHWRELRISFELSGQFIDSLKVKAI